MLSAAWMAVGCGDDLVAPGEDEVGGASSDTASPDESETESETETGTETESGPETETETGEQGPQPGDLRWHLEPPGTVTCLATEGEDLLLGGSHSFPLAVPNGTFEATTEDAMLLRVDPDGEVVWGRSYGAAAADSFEDLVRVDGQGWIAAMSYAFAETNYGGEDLPPAQWPRWQRSMALLGLDGDFDHLWSVGFEAPFSHSSLAADGLGRVSFGGRIEGAIELVGTVVPAPEIGYGAQLSVAVGGAEATPTALRFYGEDDLVGTLFTTVFDPNSGVLYAAGNYSGTMNFEGASFSTEAYGSSFVVALDANDELMWGRSVTGVLRASAVEADGSLLLGGAFLEPLYFDDQLLSFAEDSYDGYVLRVSPEGTDPELLVQITGPNVEAVYELTLGPEGELGVGGWMRESADFGAGDVPHSGGHYDAFVASYTAEGALAWVDVFGSASAEQLLDLDYDDAGHLHALVWVSEPFPFQAGGPMIGEGNVVLSFE